MLNKKLYQITQNEFVNIDLIILMIFNGEDEITLEFINGTSKSYKVSNLSTHFYNYIQRKVL